MKKQIAEFVQGNDWKSAVLALAEAIDALQEKNTPVTDTTPAEETTK
jgi:hypothetical protein